MPNRNDLLKFEYYLPLISRAIHALIILAFAYVFTLLVGRAVTAFRKYAVRRMLKSASMPEFEVNKRADTISGVARTTLVTLVWIVAIIMALDTLDFKVATLLASLGVAGIAVGFGAQSIVKDVFAGVLLLLENQIRVGDVAVINGTGGSVEELNLRTTVLRSENGAVHIFPNGSIQSLSNLTRDYSYAVFETGVSYESNIDDVIALLKSISESIASDEAFKGSVLAPLDVMGVDKLADSAVIVKSRIKTLPSRQWTIGREFNRRIKTRFEEAGIDMPFPTQTVHVVQQLPPAWRDELKAAVREVMDERRD